MNNHKTKIVFFWAEKTGYLDNLIRALLKYNSDVELIHWNKRKKNANLHLDPEVAPYPSHFRNTFSVKDLIRFLEEAAPSIIVVSGWMDKGYLKAVKAYKRKNHNIVVVAGIDDQWFGTIRQKLGVVYFSLFLRKIFDFMWVCGADQYSYARFFGYPRTRILKYLYCGNFSGVSQRTFSNRRFVYVGRLMKSKGLDLVVHAHKALPLECRKQFPLVVIGDGELRSWLEENLDDHIHYKSWLQFNELARELQLGGVGIVPSRKEQWGVTVHEFAQSSMPLILSDCVGASAEFLVNGASGLRFRNGDCQHLMQQMERIAQEKLPDLDQMGKVSFKLSQSISVDYSALELMSVKES